MKKEDIRHDPVRDKIIEYIDSMKGNQSIVLTIIGSLVIMILAFGYFQNLNSDNSNNSSNIAGLAQNNFINGDIDQAIVKFERVIKDYPKTNGALQASIYILSDAIKDLDHERMNNIFNQMEEEIISTDDPIIKSYFYKAKGDIASINDFNVKAINNYKLARKYSNDNKKANYDLDISLILLKDKNYSDAKVLLENILKLDDLGFNEKNKAEELLAIAIHEIDT